MEKRYVFWEGMEPLAWNILPFVIVVFAINVLVELIESEPVAGCSQIRLTLWILSSLRKHS